MTASPENEGPPAPTIPPKLWILCGLLVLLYQLAFHLWYGGTVLGQFPVLDGQETLLLAKAIADGTLPQEPFYRAPLYAGILSLFYQIGLTEAGVIWIARLLNMLSHLAIAGAGAFLASYFWRDSRAGLTAFLLLGLYPILLHFAGDPLDTVFGLALFTGAMAVIFPLARLTGPPPRLLLQSLAGGLLLGLAIATRPHFLAAIPFLLAAFVWIKLSRPFHKWTPLLGGLLIVLLAVGVMNHRIGGEFRMLPWQGAANLYAANQPGAHGKFFVQSRELPSQVHHENPTRRETEAIFEEEVGRPAELIDEFNRFWRDRTRKMVLEDPLGFVGRMLRKGFFLLHHYEQYNNKTYAFHAARTPLLGWNPLGWGLLLVPAVTLLPLLWRQRRWEGILLLLPAIGLAAGILLYFVSGRFRILLVPPVAILAAGVATPLFWDYVREKRNRLIAFLFAGSTALLVFLPWPGVKTPPTQQEDQLLLAQAAYQKAFDEKALHYARQVLSVQPERRAAWEIKSNTLFNRFIEDLLAERHPPEELQNLRQTLAPGIRLNVGPALWVEALALQQRGETEEALRILTDLHHRNPLPGGGEIAPLLIIDPDHRQEWFTRAEEVRRSEEAASPYLLLSLALLNHQPARQQLQNQLPPTELQSALEKWSALLNSSL
ncbi:MAG: hypothetical protein LAT58_10595 [Opitutales bacterium]|nr:hypothetical protein [Opitutales bacterium]